MNTYRYTGEGRRDECVLKKQSEPLSRLTREGGNGRDSGNNWEGPLGKIGPKIGEEGLHRGRQSWRQARGEEQDRFCAVKAWEGGARLGQ